MNKEALIKAISKKQSYLCVGLDPDLDKLPPHLLKKEDPVFEFNKQIIDATLPFAVSYKCNIAFYESMGVPGWEALEKTAKYLPSEVFKIADAKRCDIGNTANHYAKTYLKDMGFDAMTVVPYMGLDSLMPYYAYDDKWVIIVTLTSNAGSADFQMITSDNHFLYETVIQKVKDLNKPNTMFVIGGTNTKLLKKARALAPGHFFLVPGLGAQGGNIEDISSNGLNKDVGLLVNSSRSIIYADPGGSFAEKAGQKAKELQTKMEVILKNILV